MLQYTNIQALLGSINEKYIFSFIIDEKIRNEIYSDVSFNLPLSFFLQAENC